MKIFDLKPKYNELFEDEIISQDDVNKLVAIGGDLIKIVNNEGVDSDSIYILDVRNESIITPTDTPNFTSDDVKDLTRV